MSRRRNGTTCRTDLPHHRRTGALPRDQVLPNVEQCAARGVGGVVIYTSGFAETATAEGIALQFQDAE